jgi:hypothetical protein
MSGIDLSRSFGRRSARVRISAFQVSETIFISAAVGSMAGRIAKAKGARRRLCRQRQKDRLGARAWSRRGDQLQDGRRSRRCVRRRQTKQYRRLFRNVGGVHLDAVLTNAKDHARFVICGSIAGYDDEPAIAIRHNREARG